MDLETAGWHASPDSSHSAARAIGIIRRPTRTSGSTFTVPVSVQSWRVGKEEGESIALYERTLAAQGRVLGADHPDTLISRNDLAGAYEQAGGRTKRLTFCSAAQVRNASAQAQPTISAGLAALALATNRAPQRPPTRQAAVSDRPAPLVPEANNRRLQPPRGAMAALLSTQSGSPGKPSCCAIPRAVRAESCHGIVTSRAECRKTRCDKPWTVVPGRWASL
jgi:hypothetical protein